MTDYSKLTLEELKATKTTLVQQNMLIGLAGSIVGVVYANRTGGGFWRYIGYWIAGGVVVGLIPRITYFVPKSNEIDALIKEKETATKTNG